MWGGCKSPKKAHSMDLINNPIYNHLFPWTYQYEIKLCEY